MWNEKIVILIILATLFGGGQNDLPKSNREAVVIKKAEVVLDTTPIFLQGNTYESLDGTLIDFSQVKGKVLFLDFWGTWCRPCIRQHPDVDELEKKINHPDFQLVMVSTDRDSNRQKWKNFVKEEQWAGMHIRMKQGAVENPLNRLVTEIVREKNREPLTRIGVPRYFVVDKQLHIFEIDDLKSAETLELIMGELSEKT